MGTVPSSGFSSRTSDADSSQGQAFAKDGGKWGVSPFPEDKDFWVPASARGRADDVRSNVRWQALTLWIWIPASAGMPLRFLIWIPAFAGMASAYALATFITR